MRKIILFGSLLFSIYATQAQLPVSHSQENKNVVLEEFTGIHCGYCPDGHKISQQIYDAHPNDVVLINIHTGYFATPSGSDPDFRTAFGSAIANQSNLSGYPSGTVNRHYFGHSQGGAPSGATALGRGQWTSDANTILSQASYANVALETTVDTQTRLMTVNVEVYYTGNSPQSTNYLNVALLQNNVEGPQSGSSYNPSQVLPNGKYNHLHMLRHLLTGQWGEVINTTTQGTLIQKQYTYTLPADINGVPLEPGNLEVVAFVTETHQEVITGNISTISYTGLQYNVNAVTSELTFNDNICNPDILNPKLKIENNGSQVITDLTIAYSVNGGNVQTYNWTGIINSLGNKTIDLPNLNFDIQTTNNFTAEITSVNGVADDNATDNTISQSFSGAPNAIGTDYVVNIVQDQYGNQTMWGVMDSSGVVVAQGGPYSNLSGAGTQTHHHNITLSNYDCYQFVILDSNGDGINNGHGNGSYQLIQSDGTVILQGDGHFASQDIKYFEAAPTANTDDTLNDTVKVYPNPGIGYFTFENVAQMNLEIYNAIGVNVYNAKNLPSSINLDLSNLPQGVYLAKFVKNNKVGVKKIIINK